jgi:hypothetical protein
MLRTLLMSTRAARSILQRVLGNDATKQFWKYHNEAVLKKYQQRLKVGTIGAASSAPAKEPEKSNVTTEETTPAPVRYSPPRQKVVQSTPKATSSTTSDGSTAKDIFGDVIPPSNSLISAHPIC